MPRAIIFSDEIGAMPPMVRVWFEKRSTWLFDQRQVSDTSSGEAVSSQIEEEQQGAVEGNRDADAVESHTAPASFVTEGTTQSASKAPAATLDLHRLIAERAYEIWENEGRPQGYDLIHWKSAEQQIMDAVKKT